MRSTWCTTCAAAEKCGNFTWARLGDPRANYRPHRARGFQKAPFVDLNWRALREQLNTHLDLADRNSPAVQKLITELRLLNLDLADLFPPILRISESPVVARELLVQLRPPAVHAPGQTRGSLTTDEVDLGSVASVAAGVRRQLWAGPHTSTRSKPAQH